VVVAPDDVSADHAGLFLVGSVVGAVEGDVAQGRELGFYAVEPGRIGRGAGDLDVAGRGPCPDPGVFGRGQVRAEVVADDRDAGRGRVQGAQVAAELQKPGSGLAPAAPADDPHQPLSLVIVDLTHPQTFRHRASLSISTRRGSPRPGKRDLL